jgi:hypothetical protein
MRFGMTKHLITERSDGNGTPAGIRISWAAAGVITAVILAISTLVGFIRTNDIRAIQSDIQSLRSEFYSFKEERMRDWSRNDQDHKEIKEQIESLRLLIIRKMDEDK